MQCLSQRGPDQQGSFVEERIALGHRRLSILDTSSAGRQPMTDSSGRYILVYNGEIFNFKTLRKELVNKGISFHSDSDTEVLLKLFIHKKERCLNDLVGFFAFAVYDRQEESLFLARDRFGIKPLLFFSDEDKFIFASEMKALLAFNIPRELDYVSLSQYLHFNYIPTPSTILNGVSKLEPGYFLEVRKGNIKKQKYYSLENETVTCPENFEEASAELFRKMNEAVEMQMVSDVPLGAFLSGGLDSSIIAALASRKVDRLSTFTIGYSEDRYFDESRYAAEVAKKFSTDHYLFEVSRQEMFENFRETLDYIDEPFADSSALAVQLLAKKTAGKVKVALSGDGADELFGGYNKHRAEWLVRNDPFLMNIASAFAPLVSVLPKSRSSFLGNIFRQLEKLAEGGRLSVSERYYHWAGFLKKNETNNLLTAEAQARVSREIVDKRKNEIVRYLTDASDLNKLLLSDVCLVLPGDMLFKVDLMSMKNSLEVRPPFLDHRLVGYAFSLPERWKIGKKQGKLILREAFKDLLPETILTRDKKGFEVPLLPWLRTELAGMIHDELLSEKFIREQNIFSYSEIIKLKQKLFSANPGDSAARIWGLVVFQYWFKKYFIRDGGCFPGAV